MKRNQIGAETKRKPRIAGRGQSTGAGSESLACAVIRPSSPLALLPQHRSPSHVSARVGLELRATEWFLWRRNRSRLRAGRFQEPKPAPNGVRPLDAVEQLGGERQKIARRKRKDSLSEVIGQLGLRHQGERAVPAAARARRKSSAGTASRTCRFPHRHFSKAAFSSASDSPSIAHSSRRPSRSVVRKATPGSPPCGAQLPER